MYVKLQDIKGIGPKMLKKLYTNNIFNPYDLVLRTPVNFNKTTIKEEISHLDHNDIITIKGEIVSDIKTNLYTRVKFSSFNIAIKNEIIEVIAFNQTYLDKQYKVSDEIVITGKYNFNKRQITASKITTPSKYQTIEVDYNLKDIKNKWYNNVVKEILDNKQVNIYENIPNYIISKYSLVERQNALYSLHFPINKNEVNKAQTRLKYEEAYLFLKELSSRINVSEKRESINYDLREVKKLIASLPFDLTNDQKEVTNEIFSDYKKSKSTFRLIQGDVGSGKTVVALIAIIGMLSANKQVAFMAPTEMLANQQYQYFKNNLKEYNVSLLTSKVKNQETIKSDLKNGKINLIVGTHSLASPNVDFKDLGLVIIDEQHKFGVNIRKNLANKGNSNLIYLTATPIPRTLALTLFGQAKISSIKEKPKNRKDVKTIYINDDNIENVFKIIKERLIKNEKTFIVVPAIDSDYVKHNIETTLKLLKENNLDDNVSVLHGRLTNEQQDLAINDFLLGNKKILLSTSMVEVGIDIKEATLMVILSAEQFGLSQLHQLRGRVGRSDLMSECYLIGTKDEKERLELLTKTNDGFILSEYDLKLRGPGELIGLEQSGIQRFKYLNYINDYKILKEMNEELNKKTNNML